MDPVIIFDQLEKRYGAVKVLQGISGFVDRGEVLAVIGSSGCGKSTLLRCLNGLERVDGGTVIVKGINLSHAALGQTEWRQLHSEVGMVFQQFNLFPHLSVLENLMLAPRKVLQLTASESRERALHYLAEVGLPEKAQAYPEQLSGGQKQRVAIARSLCMEPQVMLFDEPTSALDPELVGEVLEVMQQLAETGMTMVVVTHEILFAQEVAHRVMFLDQGSVCEQGIAQEVLQNPQTDRLRTFLRRLRLTPSISITNRKDE